MKTRKYITTQEVHILLGTHDRTGARRILNRHSVRRGRRLTTRGRPRTWHAGDVHAVVAARSLMSTRAVAESVGEWRRRVLVIMRALQQEPIHRSRGDRVMCMWTPEQVHLLRDHLRDLADEPRTYTVTAAARRFRVARPTLISFAARLGVEWPVTLAQLTELERVVVGGESIVPGEVSQALIREEFGLSREQIDHIRRREGLTHSSKGWRYNRFFSQTDAALMRAACPPLAGGERYRLPTVEECPQQHGEMTGGHLARRYLIAGAGVAWMVDVMGMSEHVVRQAQERIGRVRKIWSEDAHAWVVA